MTVFKRPKINYQMETKDAKQMAIDALYEHATVLLFVRHKSEQETIHVLMADGLEESSARKIVKDLLERVALAKQERARKDMLYGGLWCLAGLAITIMSYNAASGGGTYVVAWGAIIFGGYQFFKGLGSV